MYFLTELQYLFKKNQPIFLSACALWMMDLVGGISESAESKMQFEFAIYWPKNNKSF